MTQSLLVYSSVAILLWKLGRIAAARESHYLSQSNRKLPFWTWEIVLSLLIFATISGIRWNVGIDYPVYLEWYKYKLSGDNFSINHFEFGFESISNILALIGFHFSFYFALWAFLQIFFIYYTVKNERYLLPFIGVLIIWGPHYLSWMNGIRQMIAACIFVYSINYISKKKLLPYILCILIASSFHRSALLLIVFYLLPQRDYFKNKYINISLIIVSVIIGLNPFWLEALYSMEQALNLIGYQRYSERLDLFIDRTRMASFGPRSISLLLLSILNVWFAPKLKLAFSNTNYLSYFNLMFIGALMHNLFINTSHIFMRPVSYLTIFSVLTTSYLLYYYKPNNYKINTPFIVVLITSISYLAFSLISVNLVYENEFINYKFFWNNR